MDLKRFAAAVLAVAMCGVSAPADGMGIPAWAEVSADAPAAAPETSAAASEAPADAPTIVASDDCTDTLNWTLYSNGLLTIEGSGRLDVSFSNGSPSWYKYRSDITDVLIGEGVTYIAYDTFQRHTNLASVTVLSPLCEIADSASVFYNALINSECCYDGVLIGCQGSPIEEYARKYDRDFLCLDADASGECGDSLCWAYYESYGLLTFSGEGDMDNYSTQEDGAPWRAYRDRITRIRLPETMTSIGNFAFADFTQLTEVTIPDSVTRIGRAAFAMTGTDRPQLRSVQLGKGVTRLAASAFHGQTSLEAIHVASGNPAYLDEQGILFDQEKTTLLLYPAAMPADSYTIPETVTAIGSESFFGAGALQEVRFPAALTSIGSKAFGSCTSLTAVIFPEGLESVGNEAFCGCENLSSVVFLGTSCTIDGEGATFCSSLTDDVAAFGGTFYAPADADALHYAERCGRRSAVLAKDNSGSCGANMIWYFDAEHGQLAILGTGAMTFSGNTPAWANYRSKITTLYLQEGIRVIPRGAFFGMSEVAEIRIPDSVTEVGEDAFAMNQVPNESKLRSVIIGKGLSTISQGAFRRQSNLLSFTVSPGNTAFCAVDGVLFSKDGTRLVSYPLGRTATSYAIPEGVERIDGSAFSDSTHLTAVTFPDSLAEIGDAAFRNVPGLTAVSLPAGLTSLGSESFAYCNQLAGVKVPPSVTCIHRNAFEGTAWVKSLSQSGKLVIINNVLVDGTSAAGDVVIPEGVTRIGSNAFGRNTKLTSVTIPQSVEAIDLQGFYGCSSLQTIDIPLSVSSIGHSAFWMCTGLTDATIRNPVCKVGSGLNAFPEETVLHGYADSTTERFARSYSRTFAALDAPAELASGTWGELSWRLDASGILSISGTGDCPEGDAPWAKHKMQICRVVTEEGVTGISARAFEQYPRLISVYLADSVTAAGDRAFSGCGKLRELRHSTDLKQFGAYVFEGTPWLADHYRGDAGEVVINSVLVDGSRMQGDVVLDSLSYSIAPYAVAGNTAITSLEASGRLSIVGEHAFEGCTALTTLSFCKADTLFNKGLKEIGEAAFLGCTALQTVTIPQGTERIGRQAFANCAALKTVDIREPDAIEIYDDAATFCNTMTDAGCTFTGTICGELRSAAQRYAQAYGRRFEGRKRAVIRGRCGRQSNWKLDGDDVLTIYGSCELDDWSEKDTPWEAQKWRIERIRIDDGVDEISTNAFAGCTSLREISIPGSVYRIDAHAFRGCESLQSICLPALMTYIKDGAFEGCSALTSITLPRNLNSIGSEVFAGCDSLESVIFLKADTRIADAPGLFSAGTVVRGYADSTAQAYAEAYGYTFRALLRPGDLNGDGCLTHADAELLQAALVESISLTDDQFLAADLNNNGVLESGDLSTLLLRINAAAVDALYFEKREDGICITGLKTPVADLYIPDKINDVKVVAIADEAFAGCTGLQRVELSAPEIGSKAFSGCEDLTEIRLPGHVTSIGRDAFEDTPWLAERRKTDRLVTVGDLLIDGTAARGRISLPEGIARINEGAFAGNTLLRSIVIPAGVEEIGAEAFALCPSLTSVAILDPECRINDAAGTISNEQDGKPLYHGVIYGYQNSTAQDYAIRYGREFRALDKAYPTGDVDFDGEVTMDDADLIMECYAALASGQQTSFLTPEQQAAADLNGDGSINSADASIAMSLIPDEPEETTTEATTEATTETTAATTTEAPETTTATADGTTTTTAATTATEPGTTTTPAATTATEPGTTTTPATTTATEPGTTSTTAGTTTTSTTAAETTTEAATGTEPAETTAAGMGDVNHDGDVTASDAAIILTAAARAGTTGKLPLTANQILLADLNRDGEVNASDAALVLIFSAKKGTGYTGAMEEFLEGVRGR